MDDAKIFNNHVDEIAWDRTVREIEAAIPVVDALASKHDTKDPEYINLLAAYVVFQNLWCNGADYAFDTIKAQISEPYYEHQYDHYFHNEVIDYLKKIRFHTLKRKEDMQKIDASKYLKN